MFFQYLPRCNFDLKIHRLKESLIFDWKHTDTLIHVEKN